MAPLLTSRIDLGNGMWEEAVQIGEGDDTVRGNLIGGAESKPTAVLFLHGWGGVRSGPHNLLTSFARHCAGAGYASLRFDFRGRGESALAADAVTLGHMGDDAVAAARYLLQRSGCRRLWLVGICSGGNVGIGVVDRLPEVAGMFLLSVYPFGEADSFSRDARRSAHFLRVYWRKLWRGETWRRMLRGEVSYGGVWQVLTASFRKDRRRADDTLTVADADTEAAPPADEKRASPLDALRGRHLPIRITYGDADPDFHASHDYFAAFSRESGYGIELTTLPGANHNFYALRWKEQLADELLAMLEGDL